jgi:AcrR family transcriptional regulator
VTFFIWRDIFTRRNLCYNLYHNLHGDTSQQVSDILNSALYGEKTMVDRRTARTRKWLQGALRNLLQEKSFEDITVQEIADEADTARITFYRHYKDKSELLMDFLNRVYEEIKPLLLSPFDHSEKETAAVGNKNLEIFLKHIYSKKKLYQAILLGSIATPVRKQLRNAFVEQIMRAMKRAGDDVRFGERAEVIAIVVAEGMIGCTLWWLENDCPQKPEELAETIINLFELGAPNLRDMTPDTL